MKLSIITINYTNFEGLQKTMQSVFAQTFTDYEYIIIDGGSTDGSKELIQQHSDKVAYWVSEKDSGVYNAMNKGIIKAKGDYLLFLNSGDWLVNKNVIELILKNEDGHYDIIYGNLERTFPDGRTDSVKMPSEVTFDFLMNATLCHPVTFIKHSLFGKFGLYDETLKIVSDWAFFLKNIVFSNLELKYKDINVVMFDMDGLSSKPENQLAILAERELVIKSLPNKITNLFYEFERTKHENVRLHSQANLNYQFKSLIKSHLRKIISKR
jgi:glycosyltransferase involved in cell wall biosynthesis